MYQRPLSIAILAIVGIAAASDGLALGFGRVPDSIPFGQALDLLVPLRLDAGESVAPACVQAEVHIGDQRLAADALRITLERREDLGVRIRSAQAVQEPLVAVSLSVGCSGSVSRQFVVFADPPDSRADARRMALADLPPATPLPASAPAALPPGPLAVPRPQAIAAAAAAGASPHRPRQASRPSPNRGAAQAAALRAQAQSKTTKARPDVVARKAVSQRSMPATAPRLKLDEPAELLKAAVAAVAAQDAALASATQAASAAQAAASAAKERLVVMDSQLKTLRDEASTQRAAMQQLRTSLAQAEAQSDLQTALFAGVALLAALAAWLGWRVRALQRERQAAWWQGAADAEAADAALPAAATLGEAAWVTAPAPMVQGVPLTPVVPALPPVEDDASASQRAALRPASALAETSLLRPVSVDELIDLEQQAEFFVLLGEEDAAVDLLVSHLRSTSGASPLPFLKLLEICRRRGDREAYERMGKRFGQRFNAVAPEWDADPEQGRDLQDYPVVLAVLQACWSRPLDAMAQLESLLFGKRSAELFELPAYRDVLTLYSVARDLNRLGEQPSPDVDLLLPLGQGGDPAASLPLAIFDTLASGRREAAPMLEDRLTAPVDLDLSEPLPLLQDSRPAELQPVGATLRQGY